VNWELIIDTDVAFKRQWRKAGLDSLQSSLQDLKIEHEKNLVSICVRKEHKAPGKECGFRTKESYMIFGDGLIKIELEINPFGELPNSLPRLGYEIKVPDEYSRVSWYGKGPGDSYSDRGVGMKIGVFASQVEDLFINYPMPQENGNRSDVRWLEIANYRKTGLKFYGDQKLNFSARKFTTSNLTQAKHSYDLIMKPYTIVNIDFEQGPIGNKSCGPEALEKYWLKPEPGRYVLNIITKQN